MILKAHVLILKYHFFEIYTYVKKFPEDAIHKEYELVLQTNFFKGALIFPETYPLKELNRK